jgi:hypothetical protein
MTACGVAGVGYNIRLGEVETGRAIAMGTVLTDEEDY